MSSSTLFRLSGGILIVGSLFAIAGFLLHPGGNNPANYLSPIWFSANLLIMVGALLVSLGLPGMYARQAERAGKLGLIGFMFPALATNVITRSLLTGPPPATYGRLILVALLLELIGPLLLGIATLRAKIFPSWTGWLLIATPVIVLVGFFVSLPGPLAQLDAVVLYVALAGMGISLLAGREITKAQAAVSTVSS